MMYTVEAVQIDITNPETFQYRVFNGGKFVVAFATLDEANDFIEDHGGARVTVRLWRRGIQAFADQ